MSFNNLHAGSFVQNLSWRNRREFGENSTETSSGKYGLWYSMFWLPNPRQGLLALLLICTVFYKLLRPSYCTWGRYKAVRLSAVCTGRLYPPGNILGAHFCLRLNWPQKCNADGRIMTMKNSSDTIGNRTLVLPACSVVSQPTAPPRVPCYII